MATCLMLAALTQGGSEQSGGTLEACQIIIPNTHHDQDRSQNQPQNQNRASWESRPGVNQPGHERNLKWSLHVWRPRWPNGQGAPPSVTRSKDPRPTLGELPGLPREAVRGIKMHSSYLSLSWSFNSDCSTPSIPAPTLPLASPWDTHREHHKVDAARPS